MESHKMYYCDERYIEDVLIFCCHQHISQNNGSKSFMEKDIHQYDILCYTSICVYIHTHYDSTDPTMYVHLCMYVAIHLLLTKSNMLFK